MPQKSCHGWEVHRLDESPRGVVAEAVRVDVWHIGATAQHRLQVADAAVGVRTALPGRLVRRPGLARWRPGPHGPKRLTGPGVPCHLRLS